MILEAKSDTKEDNKSKCLPLYCSLFNGYPPDTRSLKLKLRVPDSKWRAHIRGLDGARESVAEGEELGGDRCTSATLQDTHYMHTI